MTIPQVLLDLETAGVLAVLVVDKARDAVPLAEALLEGGINAMELTLRTDAAVESMREIRQALPEMMVGIGTILTPDQVREVAGEGAAFGVSPGVNRAVIEAAAACDLPFAPGIATPSDIEAALSLGCRRLKLFPAEHLGGLPYLRSIAAPFNHLGIKYTPLGGVGPKNLRDYLSEPLVSAVGGSWLAPRDAIASRDWERIKQNAQEARDIVNTVRRE